jgi:AraC-like DNA-binding protein
VDVALQEENAMQTLSTEQAKVSPGTAFVENFSTKELPPEDQFDVWRSLLSETIELLPTPESSRGLEVEFSSWNIEDLTFSRALYGNAPTRYWRHRRRSFMDHWCVVLARSYPPRCHPSQQGALHEESLSFRSLAVPFEGQAHDTEVLTLFLPRDFCQDERYGFEQAHDLSVNPELGALLAGYMDTLARQLPRISPEHRQGLAGATRSLVAACIAPSADRSEAAQAPLASLTIERARHVVHQNMASPDFGPEQLARLMAMSRSKLYRLFESTGGVAHFINRERLREARRRLASHREAPSIHVISNEVGFVDHSTFSRAFRREFGCSPSEAREKSLAELSTQPLRRSPESA